MKIQQNVTFLNNGAAPAGTVSKGSAAVKPSAAEPSTVAGQARAPSSTGLLPSTQGDFDAARVAEIRASISAGRYQVNTSRIADGLLSTVRELLNKDAT